MAGKNHDYIKLLVRQMDCCLQASTLLEQLCAGGLIGKNHRYQEQMGKMRQAAGQLYEEITAGLLTAFITPIDQEDIARLAQLACALSDAQNQAVQAFYMYQLYEAPRQAAAMAQAAGRCTKALRDAAAELENLKKPENLCSAFKTVRKQKTEADTLYTEAIHTLFKENTAPKTLLGRQAVYDALKRCWDLCGYGAGVMEQIVMKNT